MPFRKFSTEPVAEEFAQLPADFIPYPAIGVEDLRLAAGRLRRIVEADMDALGTADPGRTFVHRIAAEGNDIVETLVAVKAEMVRAVGRDIDTDSAMT